MMTYNRARQILASYGGQPNYWPASERAGLQRLLESDKSLQALQQQALQLDYQLTGLFVKQAGVDPERLAQQISSRLPKRKPARLNPATWFRQFHLRVKAAFGSKHSGGMAATLAMALLVAVGLASIDNRLTDNLPLPSDPDPWIVMADALDNASGLELFAELEPGLFEESADKM